METLIDFDYDKREYRGILAESWTVKGNKLHFTVRKGVRFHDGTPFSGKDVIASLKRMITDKQSLVAPSLQNIKEMELPDDFNFVLTLKKADATALEDLNNRVIMKQQWLRRWERQTVRQSGPAHLNLSVGSVPAISSCAAMKITGDRLQESRRFFIKLLKKMRPALQHWNPAKRIWSAIYRLMR